MTLGVIVPVKPFARGKSRLANVLTPVERVNLNRNLFLHTLEVLNATPGLAHILVISQDADVLALASEHGAHIVQENGASQLNLALEKATDDVRRLELQAVLVLPADLPLLSPQDVEILLERAKSPPVVVIAPDHRRQGTNALLVSPLELITYNFGLNSFEKHCQDARSAGARLEVVESPSLALDVDLPEDLERVAHQTKIPSDIFFGLKGQ